MEAVVLIIHLVLALAIIGLVLLQRSEGGGLGIGGSGGMGALASARGTANILTRATAFCAAGFFTTSLILGILAGSHSTQGSILDRLDEAPAAAAPVTAGEEAGATGEDKAAAPVEPPPVEKAPAPPSAPVSD